jgi:hypothetical protein
MLVRVYSAMADHPEWRMERNGQEPYWEGNIPVIGEDHFLTNDQLCDKLFRYFNRVDPEDSDRLYAIGYDLPSMSSGDMLAFQVDKVWYAFSCTPYGWQDIHPEEMLLNAHA